MIAMNLINFQKVFKKKPTYFPRENVNRLINLIGSSKSKDLKCEIYLVHCRGRDCIMLVSYFKGFYDKHRQFLSKNCYFRQIKTGMLFLIE